MKKLLIMLFVPHIIHTTTGNYTIPLVPAQINTQGYCVIDKPGNYILTNDLNYYPVNYQSGDPILYNASISILSSDVTLNLNGHTISHVSDKNGSKITTSGVCGITIVSGGLQNITIENGKFNTIAGNAISCYAGTNNLKLKNLTITNCGSSAILLQGDINPLMYIKNVSIENCSISNCNGTLDANGIFIGDDQGNAIGIDMSYVYNSSLTKVICSHNIMNTSSDSKSDADSLAAGIRLIKCNMITFSECECNNHVGVNSFGFLQIESNNCTFNKCKAQENHNNLPSTIINPISQQAAGFMIQGSTACSYNSCSAYHNYASNNNAAGFFLDGTYINNDSIYIPCTYLQFNQCTAINNISGYKLNTKLYGAGFLSLGLNHLSHNYGNSFVKCLAQGNDSSSNTESNEYNIAAGIACIYEQSSIIEKCHCINNGNPYDTNTRTISNEPNYTIPLVMGYGIYLGPEGQPMTNNDYTVNYTYTKNLIIKECWLMFNSHAGLKDDGLDSQSLIMQNYAFRNGTQDKQLVQGPIDNYATNYAVSYIKPNERLTITSSSVGDLNALNTTNPYTNIEWQAGPPQQY